ncbi:hypothetical protein LVJ94_32515 [Pendulispora rubella]|uniref:Aldose 1-epimerase n=1 Tax=Pendulispora rubella TaxID=2741070 RepID=A0ABZ2KX91_9BACT
MALPVPTSLESVVLTHADACAYVAPGRGGMVTRFFVGERPVLYLDEATLVDTTKNVRGGIPVLFPSPGKLADDRFSRGGRTGKMGQHGFARNAAWKVAARAEDEVTLRLASSEETRAVYPWDFVLTYRYVLGPRALRIEQRIETTGDDPMPFGAGFHPYFQVAQSAKGITHVPTKATRAWDNAKKELLTLERPLDLTGTEVDLHLVDHDSSRCELDLGDGHIIVVDAPEPFRRWIVWTLGGRDFVCVEPWTSPANALNSGVDLLTATRGAPLSLVTEIAFR